MVNRYMDLISPNLNYLITAGTLLMYTAVYFFTHPEVSSDSTLLAICDVSIVITGTYKCYLHRGHMYIVTVNITCQFTFYTLHDADPTSLGWCRVCSGIRNHYRKDVSTLPGLS